MSATVLGYIENLQNLYNFITPLNARRVPLPMLYAPKKGDNKHIWQMGGTRTVHEHMRMVDPAISTNMMNNIVNAISQKKSISLEELNNPKHNVILLQNGWLNLNNFEFMSYKETDAKGIDLLEKYNHTWTIPVNYDDEANDITYIHFLREVMGVSLEQDWHEVIGFTLTSGYKHKKIFCLYGEGDTGKTTLMGVIRKFLGDSNIVSVSPQKLSKTRFASATLQGKVANLCGDIPNEDITDTSTLKQLCGEDTINAEHKGQNAFEFMNFAKMYFAMNEVPKSDDDTMAWYNRIKFFLFKKSESKIIKNSSREELINSMTSEEGLSVILNKSLEGLKRLRERGRFLDTYQPKLTYIKFSDPVRYFIENDCADSGWTHKEELYEQYLSMPYSREMTRTKFYKEMKPLFMEDRVRIDEDYRRVYMVTLKPRKIKALGENYE